jgi:UDP-3-O-[3-hydroxymyristoyl] glucosamine N-acyltransferase
VSRGPPAQEDCLIGANVYVESFTHIMRNVKVGDFCRISAIIADSSVIGHHASIFGTLTHRNRKGTLETRDRGSAQ